MTSVLERVPGRVQASLVDRVLASPHPKLALPTIASNAHMTIADLQTVLSHHGYPDRTRMTAARDRLLAELDQAADAAAPAPAPTEPTEPAATDRPRDAADRFADVAVADLHPDPDNPREKILDTDVEELADSIAELGLLQPIVARQADRGLVVVAGHRRLTAVKLLGWTHVPTIIRTHMRPDHVLAAMLVENGQRRDLDPIEEARGLNRLKTETGATDMEVAKRVGRTQPFVSSRLALLLLSPEDQAAVRAGELGITQATLLGRTNGGKVRQGRGRKVENHFDAVHELAVRARARCKRLGHRTKVAGGQACGACWESVIRADERDAAQKAHLTTGTCPTCG